MLSSLFGACTAWLSGFFSASDDVFSEEAAELSSFFDDDAADDEPDEAFAEELSFFDGLSCFFSEDALLLSSLLLSEETSEEADPLWADAVDELPEPFGEQAERISAAARSAVNIRNAFIFIFPFLRRIKRQ